MRWMWIFIHMSCRGFGKNRWWLLGARAFSQDWKIQREFLPDSIPIFARSIVHSWEINFKKIWLEDIEYCFPPGWKAGVGTSSRSVRKMQRCEPVQYLDSGRFEKSLFLGVYTLRRAVAWNIYASRLFSVSSLPHSRTTYMPKLGHARFLLCLQSEPNSKVSNPETYVMGCRKNKTIFRKTKKSDFLSTQHHAPPNLASKS